MHMLLRLPLLGLGLFSSSTLAMAIAQGTTLTAPTNAPKTNGSLNANSGTAFVCVKATAATRTQPPWFADCAGALRSLPLDPTIGEFYNSGHGDFQLPQFVTYKTCTVIVELRDSDDKVRSNWLAVHMAATELNEACQAARMQTGLGYGYTYLDFLRSLKITLKGPDRQVGDGGSETDGTATS